jgi:integrase/recombinase XerD
MTKVPARELATVKPVPSPPPQPAKAKSRSRTAPPQVAAAKTVKQAKVRPASEPHVPAPPRPVAATLLYGRDAGKARHTTSPNVPAPAPQTGMALHTANGARKYLTAGERDAFLLEADVADRPVRTLCMTLAYAGCRLSEALALTTDRVDLAAGVLTIESLKKRRTGIYRVVPVPPALLETLDMVHGIREARSRRGKGRSERLWPWSRMTGWRAVHAVMQAAGLDGPHASPKGLRHGFGVSAVSAGIPLNLVQKWLGHAQLSTTAIYADAVGAEEKDIAQRMWR